MSEITDTAVSLDPAPGPLKNISPAFLHFNNIPFKEPSTSYNGFSLLINSGVTE